MTRPVSDEVRGQKGAVVGGGVALEAGRELDVLVAVRLMDWRITHRGHRVLTHFLDRRTKERVEVRGYTGNADAMRYIASVCDAYSTDIAAAWEVVEAMQKRAFVVEVVVDCFNDGVPAGVDAKFWLLEGDEFTAHGDTAPLAICRAALAALATPTSSEPTPADTGAQP